MNIKVLGGSGFIGSHLINSLDNSESISLRDDKWYEKIENADVLINLVGKAHDHKGVAAKSDYFFANFELVKDMFNKFLQSNASLFLHVSSIAAIEEIESDMPLTEESDYNPISYYGFSKMEAEKWLLNQEIPEGKKLIILRPPMVHGPFDKGNLGLLFKFVVNGIPYPLSKYENKRSFIYIENFVYYIHEIINKFQKIPPGIYHVSDNEYISTNQIMDIIGTINNKRIIKIGIPKILIKGIAIIGDLLPIPLNSKRLKKLTSNLLVSNNKLNRELGIIALPFTAKEGLYKTIISFNDEQK